MELSPLLTYWLIVWLKISVFLKGLNFLSLVYWEVRRFLFPPQPFAIRYVDEEERK